MIYFLIYLRDKSSMYILCTFVSPGCIFLVILLVIDVFLCTFVRIIDAFLTYLRDQSLKHLFTYLSDGVIDIDGGHLQLPFPHHLVQVVHASGGLLAEPLDAGKQVGVVVVHVVGEVSTVVKDQVQGLWAF